MNLSSRRVRTLLVAALFGGVITLGHSATAQAAPVIDVAATVEAETGIRNFVAIGADNQACFASVSGSYFGEEAFAVRLLRSEDGVNYGPLVGQHHFDEGYASRVQNEGWRFGSFRADIDEDTQGVFEIRSYVPEADKAWYLVEITPADQPEDITILKVGPFESHRTAPSENCEWIEQA